MLIKTVVSHRRRISIHIHTLGRVNAYSASETFYYGDDALSTKPMVLIWAPLIPATRWSCSQQSLLSTGGQLQLHLVAGIRGTQISITYAMYRNALSPDIRSLSAPGAWPWFHNKGNYTIHNRLSRGLERLP